MDIKQTSIGDNLNVVDFSSFAIIFATAPTALTNCPLFSSVIYMLCMVMSKGISVEVDFFFLKIKAPFQTLQAS